MVALVTGSAQILDASGGSDSAAKTVPSDATGVILFYNQWFAGSYDAGVPTASINGVAMTSILHHPANDAGSGGNGAPGCGAMYLANPATGSQTHVLDFGEACVGGGGGFFVYVKGVDLDDLVRDSNAAASSNSAGTVSATVTSELTDLVLASSLAYNTDSTLGGTLLVDGNVTNTHHTDVTSITAGASTTSTSTVTDYPAVIAISLKELVSEPSVFITPGNSAPKYNTGIDWNNPLSDGLLFFGPVGSDKQDAVSGKTPTYPDTTAFNNNVDVIFDSVTHESNTETDGGMIYQDLPDILKLKGSAEATILVFVELDSAPAYGAFLGIPADNSTWAPPYVLLSMGRYETNTYARYSYCSSGNNAGPFNITDGFLDYDGSRHMYGVTRTNTAAARFFKDGIFDSVANSEESHANISGTNINSADVCIMSRNRAASGEGTNGRFIIGGVWNRALSDQEVADWYENPYQVLNTITPVIKLVSEVSTTIVLSINLVDLQGNLLMGLTNLSWAWFDESSPESFTSPTDKGEVESTDSSGLLEITLTNTTLTTSETGILILMDDLGNRYAMYRVTL